MSRNQNQNKSQVISELEPLDYLIWMTPDFLDFLAICHIGTFNDITNQISNRTHLYSIALHLRTAKTLHHRAVETLFLPPNLPRNKRAIVQARIRNLLPREVVERTQDQFNRYLENLPENEY